MPMPEQSQKKRESKGFYHCSDLTRVPDCYFSLVPNGTFARSFAPYIRFRHTAASEGACGLRHSAWITGKASITGA